MKAIVDADLCIGCEACVEICPEVFEMSEDVAVAKADAVPAGQEAMAKEAADSCPVDAITIEE